VVKSSHGCAISSDPANEPVLTNIAPTDLTGSEVNGLCLRGGTLSASATWDETEVAYVLFGDLIVPVGITLNWQPGIVIKLWDGNTEVYVDGTLNVNGTSGSRVYATSLRDDSLGGLTNNDNETPGWEQWGRIYVRGGGSATINYLEARYGGYYYAGNATIYTDGGTNITLDHLVVKSSHGCAISSDPANEPVMTNIAPTDLTGSEVNGLCLRGGTLSASATWDETEVAYVLFGDLIVPVGITLNWQPGIVIKLWDGNTEVYVDGTLNVNGTSASRVYATSLRDDTLAGLTNNDNETPGWEQWGRIYVRGGGSATINYLEARYGGYYYTGNATIYTDGGTNVTLDHLVVKSSHGCAISSDPANEPVLTNIAPTDLTGSEVNGLCLRAGR